MSDAKLALHWGQHEHTRASSLKQLWEGQEFLDVTIACDDDQIDAHKVILSAASPFFRNILKRNPHSHPLLYLKGTNKKTVQSLLNFIYAGETEIIQEELEEFMALANSLEVMGLTDEEQNLSVQEQINIKEQKNIKTDEHKISTTRKKQKMK